MLWPAHENKTAWYQLNTVVTQEMPIIISYPGLVQMLPDKKKNPLLFCSILYINMYVLFPWDDKNQNLWSNVAQIVR